jgi:putative salt-induced outer membrane protein YdiY
MDSTNVKRNDEGKRRKRKNEGLNRRKYTLIKKAYELGEFDGIDVALMIYKHGRYTTYRSRDHASWPPSIAEIVSESGFLLDIYDRC